MQQYVVIKPSNLCLFCKRAKLTNAKLARLLNVSMGAASRWRNGKAAPSGGALIAVAAMLWANGFAAESEAPPSWAAKLVRERRSSRVIVRDYDEKTEQSYEVVLLPAAVTRLREFCGKVVGKTSGGARTEFRLPEEAQKLYDLAQHALSVIKCIESDLSEMLKKVCRVLDPLVLEASRFSPTAMPTMTKDDFLIKGRAEDLGIIGPAVGSRDSVKRKASERGK